MNEEAGSNYAFEGRTALTLAVEILKEHSAVVTLYYDLPWNRACAGHTYACTRTLFLCTRPNWKLIHVDDTSSNGLM